MEYEVIYSKRRTLCLQITRDAKVLVRAPKGVSKVRIEEFVTKHLNWIEKHLEKRKNHPRPPLELSKDEIKELKKSAAEIIPPKVEYFSHIMGVYPEHVSINSAKTRFGSCSGKNRLNFSCRLMFYPESAIDYVVVHELAHIKYHNHSREFWAFVGKFMPDYKERRKLLR